MALILLSSGLGLVRALDFHTPPERVATYRLTGEWIAAHTPAQASVVVADLGIVGYYAQRRMIDSFGLITPAMVADREIQSAVKKFQPDYVVATQYFFFQQFVHSDWFSRDYRSVVQFSTPHDPFSPMTVYQRRIPAEPAPQPVPVTAEWQPFARLSGAAFLYSDQTWSGESIPVQLDWTATGLAAQDYNLFIHVLNADGALVAQSDGYPNGQPVTAWQTSESIREIRSLDLPPNLPAGPYRLEVGWYDWRSGQRVPVKTSSSSDADSFILPLTIHNQWPGGSGLP